MITALYAACIGSLMLVLGVRVIRARREGRVGLGDGGKVLLQRRIRAHANLSEYAPLALVMLGLAEVSHTEAWVLHALGATLVAGRIVHAIGLSQEPEPRRLRTVGMALTLTALGCLVVVDVLAFVHGRS